MPDLSPVTTQWEWLFSLYSAIGAVVGAVVMGLLVYAAVRYRSRPGGQEPRDALRPGQVPPERGRVGASIILTLVVTSILFALTLGTMQTVDLIEHTPEGSLLVEVHGFQWGWRFIYPDGRRVVGELRVPRGEVILLDVTSDDVFHNFGLTEFRIKADAIPGRVNRIWIQPSEVGTYTIQCYELCGAGHAVMRAHLIVMEPEEFAEWYAAG
jgi:cytochrome c oxidase subunit 2